MSFQSPMNVQEWTVFETLVKEMRLPLLKFFALTALNLFQNLLMKCWTFLLDMDMSTHMM